MTNILSIIDGARRVSQSHHCFAIMYRMSKKRTDKTNKDGQTWQACKHSKVVRNGQPRCFLPLGPFWACLDPVGPFQTKNDFFTQKHLCQTQLCPYKATNWFLSEMAQKQGSHSVHYSLFFIMYNILYTICNTIEAVHYWTKQTQKWPKKWYFGHFWPLRAVLEALKTP